MTPVRISDGPYVHKFCAVVIFSNITRRRQAISPITKFPHVLGRDSAGDIDFDQMSLSQLLSTILHESIILIFIKYLSANKNNLFYMKV